MNRFLLFIATLFCAFTALSQTIQSGIYVEDAAFITIQADKEYGNDGLVMRGTGGYRFSLEQNRPFVLAGMGYRKDLWGVYFYPFHLENYGPGKNKGPMRLSLSLYAKEYKNKPIEIIISGDIYRDVVIPSVCVVWKLGELNLLD